MEFELNGVDFQPREKEISPKKGGVGNNRLYMTKISKQGQMGNGSEFEIMGIRHGLQWMANSLAPAGNHYYYYYY